MKKEIIESLKKNLGVASGAAVGTVAGMGLSAAAAGKPEPDEVEVIDQQAPHTTSNTEVHHNTSSNSNVAGSSHTQQPEVSNATEIHHETQPTHESEPIPEPEPEIQPEPGLEQEPEPNNEIEVLSFERVIDTSGSPMDVAILNVEGQQLHLIDADLDGVADFVGADLNNNQIIETSEIEDISSQGILMEPYRQAAIINSQYAQDDLPDYVNNADVDTFMA